MIIDHLIIDHLEFGAAHVASPLTFDLPYVTVLSFVAERKVKSMVWPTESANQVLLQWTPTTTTCKLVYDEMHHYLRIVDATTNHVLDTMDGDDVLGASISIDLKDETTTTSFADPRVVASSASDSGLDSDRYASTGHIDDLCLSPETTPIIVSGIIHLSYLSIGALFQDQYGGGPNTVVRASVDL